MNSIFDFQENAPKMLMTHRKQIFVQPEWEYIYEDILFNFKINNVLLLCRLNDYKLLQYNYQNY